MPTFTVPGMNCAHCVTAITEEVSEVPGVTNVAIDLDTKSVTVEGAAPVAEIVEAIGEAGYEVA